MKFKEFLNESRVTTYHGDDFNTTKIDPKQMNNGNNQEGIGIYFGSLSTAQSYGKNIVKAIINHNNYIESRDDLRRHLSKKQVFDILKDMYKVDEEAMYYMITDWGVEISEPEDIEEEHIMFLAEKMLDEEVRNFQITMAEEFDTIEFVESWNKRCSKIHGTFHKQSEEENWYCIINTKQKLVKY